jgi:hypothetical protein
MFVAVCLRLNCDTFFFSASKDFSELRLEWRACVYAGLSVTRPLLLSDCNHHWSVSKYVSKAPALNVTTVCLVLFENLNDYKIINFWGGCRFWFRKWVGHFFVFGRLWLQISDRQQTNPTENFLWFYSVAPGKSLPQIRLWPLAALQFALSLDAMQ